jgi:hypothetical protein
VLVTNISTNGRRLAIKKRQIPYTTSIFFELMYGFEAFFNLYNVVAQ